MLENHHLEFIKQTMLKHEDTFRHQVRELHRLYNVQKSLMGTFRNDIRRNPECQRATLDINSLDKRVGFDLSRSAMEDTSCGDSSGIHDDKTGPNDVELTLSIGPSANVYIPGRKDKGGTYFGFVKFEGVKNIGELERSMQKVKCGHSILKVNISKYGKQDKAKSEAPRERSKHHGVHSQPTSFKTRQYAPVVNQNGRSYAEVVGSKLHTDTQAPIIVALKHVPTMAAWNDYALLGEVTNLHLLMELPKLIQAKVGVVEYDYNWHPFFHNSATPQMDYDSDEEEEVFKNVGINDDDANSITESDEDGISDTWDKKQT
ncbi:unnamed protein product [Lactuca saligna]|uniref:Uncharacterized protein n=1 Tax=Lactuca saligna TaxID=75948 RepID=A0AA35Z409_LACSI|nr:unnamed protein product [Lactuca saligna]